MQVNEVTKESEINYENTWKYRWWNGYGHWKWTRRNEFKSWT